MGDEFDPWLDHDDKNNLAARYGQGFANQVGSAPRQAGKASQASAQVSPARPLTVAGMPVTQETVPGHFDVPHFLYSKIGPASLEAGTVVTWLSRNLPNDRSYSYAAIWTGGMWYITGTGQFYGSNIFTWDQFTSQVLQHSDVTDARMSQRWVS